MSEKISMFELLKERLTEEEIIKITCDYDNKFNELEEENKQLKSELQQKENIIKEVRETLEEANEWVLGVGLKAILLEILDKGDE